MIKALAFFVYVVKNIKTARCFYEETLGLKVAHQYQEEWFEYDLGEATFVISKPDADHPAPVKGAVVAFEVDDLDAVVKKLKARKVKFQKEPFDTPVCRIAVVLDPSGNEVLLHQSKPPQPPAKTKKPGKKS